MPAAHPLSARSRRTLLLALAFACALVGVGLLLQSLRLGLYLSKAEAAQHNANTRLADLNASLETFRGDPKSAAQTSPCFKQAAAFLVERGRQIEATSAPCPAGPYRRDLIAATRSSAVFAADVGAFAAA